MLEKFGVVFLAALIAITCVGCGGSDLPDLGTVNGVITMNGQPLPQARVSFEPENGRGSTGTTDESGKYELLYVANEPGAIVGKHMISITTVLDDAADAEAIEMLTGDDTRKPLKPTIKFKETIPAKYNTNSELTAEVQAGSNTINFDLEK